MLAVETRLADFAGAALDPEKAIPQGLSAHHGLLPERRFAVYRNNVVSSLTAALRSQFPVIEKLVGEAYFKALAGLYLRSHPPLSPVLHRYGDGFAGFIAAFPPLAAYPWLADVARIERARVIAYHAADAPPLTHAELEAFDEARLGAIRLQSHPSAQLVLSPFRAFDIWQGTRQGGVDPARLASGGQAVLVLRPQLEVHVAPVGAAAASLLGIFAVPRTLSAAFELLVKDGHGGEEGAALGELLGHGALSLNTAHGGNG